MTDNLKDSSSLLSTIIFFEHSPFMSVEILGLLKNYMIVCYNDDLPYRLLKKKWNIASYLHYSKSRPVEDLESDQAVEIMLKDRNFLICV